jgi:hypothetical protein
MKTELDKFCSLINEVKVAMMTTGRPGHLESPAMANQKPVVLFELAQGWTRVREWNRAMRIS